MYITLLACRSAVEVLLAEVLLSKVKEFFNVLGLFLYTLYPCQFINR